LEDEFTIGLGP